MKKQSLPNTERLEKERQTGEKDYPIRLYIETYITNTQWLITRENELAFRMHTEQKKCQHFSCG